jgi:hypothetical protein
VEDEAIVAQARLQRKIAQTMANEQAGYAEVAAQYETAVTLLGTPAADKDTDWWQEWCQIQLKQQQLLYWWQRLDEMAAHIDRTRSLIERHGTPWQQAILLGNLSRQLIRSGLFAPSAAALDYARAALEALPATTSPEQRGPFQFGLGFNLLWYGDHAEAETVLNDALAMAEQMGDVVLQTRCLAYLLIAARRQGHVDDVDRYAQRCLEKATAVQMYDYLGVTQAGLAWLAWQRDDLAEAERLAQT